MSTTPAGTAESRAVLRSCSPLQERLWFLQLLIPESSPAYNVSTATLLRGPVDAQALEDAFWACCRRHESLRTTFPTVNGEPARVVAPVAEPVPLEVVDLSAHPSDAAVVKEAVVAQAMRTFDLNSAPLASLGLLLLSRGESVLVLCLSHMVADGWSMGILHRELGVLYSACLMGKPTPLPQLDADYSDWVLETRRRAKKNYQRDMTFWRGELAGVPISLDLPFDRKRPDRERYVGNTKSFPVPPTLTFEIAELAREMRATPFSVYLSAYALLLAAWSGQRQVLIGSPWANRRTVAAESIVGPLMEMLLLPVKVDPETTIDALVGSVRRSTLRAMGHPDVGFDQIVTQLRTEREPGRNPLFQAMFLLQNSPLQPVDLTACQSEDFPVHPPTARLDIALDLTEAGGTTTVTLEYNTDLFDGSTIELTGRRYLHLLSQMVSAPSATVSSLRLADEAQQHQEVHAWNATAEHLDGPRVIQELVDRVASAAPSAVALDGAADKMSYGDLRDRSITLAHVLRGCGVEPGDVVGVCLDRSTWMVVALLAVMRVGAAYLPLDPEHPDTRLADVISDAAVSVVLVARDHEGRRFGDVTVLDCTDVSFDGSATRPLPRVTPEDVAYVMYTSGSTGRPKGVMVSHRSATNMLLWGQAHLPMRPHDRMLAKTPYTFDISVWEIFGTLIAGATLVLTPPGEHKDATQVDRLLADEAITVTHFVPSMLKGVLNLPRLSRWSGLRYVFCGGEALSADVYAALAQHVDAAVYNFYGPTEATIYASWYPPDDRLAANDTVPIGRPVGNTMLYVLDDSLQPTALGLPGELYIGGVQVAEGYLRRPGLTATRFLPDPFIAVPGARMYRTGDRVRRANDGTLDFLGRLDSQIKLRGFRIELGEIESVLRCHPRVADAAVEVRQPGTADILVAHVVAIDGGSVELEELRPYLAGRLPEYMLPARVRPSGSLPLTTSGKLDRPKLAQLPLEEKRPAAAAALDGVAETVMAEVWTSVLGLQVTDAELNFFQLGGDSISAVSVVSECDRRGVSITVLDVFQCPTLAALAAAAHLHERLTTSVEDTFELAPHQGVLLGRAAIERVHMLRLKLSRPVDRLEVATAMRRLEERHAALRLVVDHASGRASLLDPTAVHHQHRGPLCDDSEEFRHEAAARDWVARVVDVTAGRPWGVAPLCAVDESLTALLVGIDATVCDPGAMGTLVTDFGRALEDALHPDDPRALSGPVTPLAGIDTHSTGFELLQIGGEETQSSPQWLRISSGLPCKTEFADIACTAVARTLRRDFVLQRPVGPLTESGGATVLDPAVSAVAVQAAAGPESLKVALRDVRRQLRRLPKVDVTSAAGSPRVIVRVLDVVGQNRQAFLSIDDVELARAPVVPAGVEVAMDIVLRNDTVTVRCTGTADSGIDPARTSASVLKSCGEVLKAVLEGGVASFVPEDFPLAAMSTSDVELLTVRFPEIEDVVPLGPMQQYIVDRLLHEEADGLFVVSFTASMDQESFDVDSWIETWRRLMDRHAGLRTSFVVDMSTGPIQIVHRRLEPSIEFIDLRHLGLEPALAEVMRLETQARTHRISLSDAPQWSMVICRILDDNYRVICRLVYSLQDGWSVAVLQDEWYVIYDALRAGQRPEVPPPPAPYATHIRALAACDQATARKYWRSNLAGGDLSRAVEATLRRRSTPDPGGREHQTCSVSLDAPAEQALRAFARREHLTLFTPLQAAWALLLAGLTGRDRVLFGTISSGRASPEIRRTYGSFNNMMPTAVDVPGSADLSSFLLDLQGEQSRARTYDYVPLSVVNAELGLPADHDLLDNYIVHENFPIDREVYGRFGRWRPDIVEMRTPHALRLLIWPVGELSLHLSFDARLTCPEDARRLMSCYRRVLTAMAEGRHSTVAELLLDPLSLSTGEGYVHA